jgi:hypothetical protein
MDNPDPDLMVEPVAPEAGLLPQEETGLLVSLINGSALAMVGVFVISVIATAFPPRLLDPLWLTTVILSVLANAGFALTGFVLIHVAAAISPDRVELQMRRDWASRFAVVVALGFLLLIPLQGYAIWRGLDLNSIAQSRQLDASKGRIQALRRVIQSSTSLGQLQAGLVQIEGPALQPADQLLPLPQLKSQLLADLARAEAGLRQRFSGAVITPGRLWSILLINLRVLLLALIFAFAFAAGAQRRGQGLPILEEWSMRSDLARQQADERRKARRQMREQRIFEELQQIEKERLAPRQEEPTDQTPRPAAKGRRGRGIVDAAYFEAILGDADDNGNPPGSGADSNTLPPAG